MDQNTREYSLSERREINLINLLWKCVQSWRLIIMLAVICAVLFAGISYLKSKQTISVTTSEDKMEETLTDEELLAVNRAKTLQRYLQERTVYQEESVYINLDAYSVDTVTLQYYIKADSLNEKSTSLLADSYRKYVESKAIAEDISGETMSSVDSKYIGELIGYTNYDVGLSMELQPFQEQLMRLEGNYDKILLVSVMGRDAEEVGELADAVEKALETYGEKISGQIAKHQLSLLNRYESVTMNSGLAATQENLQASVEALQTRYDTVTANFTDAQKAALDAEEDFAEEDQAVVEATEPASSPFISKKYVLLGLILGIVLAVIWVTLKYILDGQVKSAEELQRMSGIRILGKVHSADEKKRLFSGIDRRIASLRERPNGSPEEQMDVLLANVTISCQKEGIKKVFITSESMEESVAEQIRAMAARLEKSGIEAVYETNIAYNAMSLEHMSEIGNVIIVVKEDYTKYKELEKELTLCMDQEMNVLGAVFLG